MKPKEEKTNRATENSIISYEYGDAKNIVVCGDIHGDFVQMVDTMCSDYRLKDTLLIVAGDCGFGFHKYSYYTDLAKKCSRKLAAANDWIIFIRGNHDNPAYFDGKAMNFKRFRAIPDYSIVKACGHTILCIGGAISVDRARRKDWEEMDSMYSSRSGKRSPLEEGYYWENEPPIYNSKALDAIANEYAVDTVVTHTAPSFCELTGHEGLMYWAKDDSKLLDDVKAERETLDQIYNHLKKDGLPIREWYYGHFHQSWFKEIDGIRFKMLDIMEFYRVADSGSASGIPSREV